jgi:hypothetical protein
MRILTAYAALVLLEDGIVLHSARRWEIQQQRLSDTLASERQRWLRTA